MKPTILIIAAAISFGISCYLVGLAHGTNRGVKGSNSASISCFTVIHRLLKAGDIPGAIKLSEDAIATHAGVIQTVEDHLTSALVFLYPWMGDVLVENYKETLGGTYVYLSAYPRAVPSDTVEFLARYKNDYLKTKE